MFDARVIEARERSLHDAGHLDSLPGKSLTRYDHALCWGLRDRLAAAVDAKGQLTRALLPEETAFVLNERLLCKIDWRYWGERYAIVTKETGDAEPLFPLWASQQLVLDTLAKQELERAERGHPDGLLFNVLKARQLGVSTFTDCVAAHRVTTQGATRGLIAGDVKEQSVYLFGIAERVIAGLPWYLRPTTIAHQTGSYWEGDTGATLRSAWGKSSRGGLQDKGGEKGNIGRGKTFHFIHISECSTWERPEQLEDGLLPGVPRRPRIFGAFESTAKGRNDWWHGWWKLTDKGLGRFFNLFIPWYIEPDKYWLPPPPGWEPADTTKAHMDTVERTSPQYLLGRTHRLSAAQAYWYEQTRAQFDEQDDLHKFLEEYPATPEEAFQHAGKSIFSAKVLEALRAQERAPGAMFYVKPASEIAQLKAWELEIQRATEQRVATEQEKQKARGVQPPS